MMPQGRYQASSHSTTTHKSDDLNLSVVGQRQKHVSALTVELATVLLKEGGGLFGKNYIKDNEKVISPPQKAEAEPIKDPASLI